MPCQYPTFSKAGLHSDFSLSAVPRNDSIYTLDTLLFMVDTLLFMVEICHAAVPYVFGMGLIPDVAIPLPGYVAPARLEDEGAGQPSDKPHDLSIG